MEHVYDIHAQIKNNVPIVSIYDQQPSSRHQSLQTSWKLLLRLWSSTKQQLTRDHLVDLCSTYTEATLDYVQDKFRHLTSKEQACKTYQLVFNMLCIFDVSFFFFDFVKLKPRRGSRGMAQQYGGERNLLYREVT